VTMIENCNKRQAVVAIIQNSNKFLFVKRSDYIENAKGYWCPVSGRIEGNETQEEALKREVMEEVGLNVVAIKKICEIPSNDKSFFLHYWTTEIISGIAKITSNEATDLKWVTLEELKSLNPTFIEDIQIIENLDT